MAADLEKNGVADVNISPSTSVEITPLGPKPSTSFFGRLKHYESLLDAKLGIETEAIDRVLPEQKTQQPWHSQAVMALMWASATMNLSCFATGFLGWEFGLDLKQSILIVIFASLLGSAVTGWCATMGPGTGLRQVAISRFSFGWWPSKIIAVLNVIEQLGWSSVACITGGSALTAVSDGRVSMVLGVVIVSAVGCVFSFVGLKAVLQVEKVSLLLKALHLRGIMLIKRCAVCLDDRLRHFHGYVRRAGVQGGQQESTAEFGRNAVRNGP